MSENYPPSHEGTPFRSGDQIGLHEAGSNVVPYAEFLARQETNAALEAAAREQQPEQPVSPELHSIKLGRMLQEARALKLNQEPGSFELMSPHALSERDQKDAA